MPAMKLRPLLGYTLLLLLVCIGTLLLIRLLLMTPQVQLFLMARLSQAVGYELKAQRLRFDLGRDLQIRAYGLDVVSRTGDIRLSATSLNLVLDLSDLLRKRVSSASLIVTNPRIDVRPEILLRGKTVGRDVSPPGELLSAFVGFKDFFAENAELRIQGYPRTFGQVAVALTRRPGEPEGLSLRIVGRAGYERVPFRLQATLNAEAVQWTHLLVEGRFRTGPIPLGWIPVTDTLRFGQGDAALDLRLKGAMHGLLNLRGTLEGKGARFTLKGDENKKQFSLSRFAMTFDSRLEEGIFETTSLDLRAPGLLLRGKLRVDGRDARGPALAFEASSASMSLQTFKEYYPAPFLGPWIESELISELDGGQVWLERLLLKGTPKQLSELGQPENANCLEVRMAWSGLQLQDQNDLPPIEGLSGNLRYAKGHLRVEGREATFGRSLIRRHTLDIGGIYEDVAWCDILMDGRFDLQDLKLYATSARVPRPIREEIERIHSVSGNMEASARLRYDSAEERVRIQEGRFRFDSASFQHEALRLLLAVDDAEVVVGAGGAAVRFQGRGRWGNSSFLTTGETGDLGETLSARIEMGSDLEEIVGTLIGRETLPFLSKGPAPARVSVYRGPDRWSFDGEIRLKGIEVHVGAFEVRPAGEDDRFLFGFDLHPKGRIEARKALLVLKDSLIEARGVLEGDDPGTYGVSISSTGLRLEDLNVSYQKDPVQAAGMVNFRVEMKGQKAVSPEPQIQGEISARGVSLVSESLPFPVGEGQIRASVSGDQWKIPFVRARLHGSVIEMEGDLTVARGLEGHVTVNVPFLDLQELLAHKEEVLDGQGERFERWIRESKLRLNLKVYQARLKRLLFRPVEVELLVQDDSLHLIRLTAKGEHGSFRVRGSMTRGERAGVNFTSSFRFHGQPVEALIDSLGVKSPDMKGSMTLEGVLFSNAQDIKSLVRNLQGGGTVLVENGTTRESRVLFKILEFLSLQKIYTEGPPGVSEGGFGFERLGGEFTIEGGVLESENVVMSSPAFNLYGRGRIDLAEKVMDFDLGIQPMGTLDLLVSHIPILGYILTGREGALLIYYFVAKGPVEAPEVRYVPLKNWGKGTVGMLERLLLTPQRLMEQLSRMGEGIDLKDLPEISEQDIGP